MVLSLSAHGRPGPARMPPGCRPDAARMPEVAQSRPGAGLQPFFGIDRMVWVSRSIGFAFPDFVHTVDKIGNKS